VGIRESNNVVSPCCRREASAEMKRAEVSDAVVEAS